MKFLTDENTAPYTVQTLRSLGHNVFDIKEEGLQGSPDTAVIEVATKRGLIIVTLDKDFTKHFEEGHIKTGVIFIVHKRQKTKEITQRLVNFLEGKSDEDLIGKFSTVD